MIMLDSFQHFTVFYTDENGKNDLQHLIGYEQMPTIQDDAAAIKEFRELKTVDKPVYMGHMPRAAVMQVFGVG